MNYGCFICRCISEPVHRYNKEAVIDEYADIALRSLAKAVCGPVKFSRAEADLQFQNSEKTTSRTWWGTIAKHYSTKFYIPDFIAKHFRRMGSICFRCLYV